MIINSFDHSFGSTFKEILFQLNQDIFIKYPSTLKITQRRKYPSNVNQSKRLMVNPINETFF